MDYEGIATQSRQGLTFPLPGTGDGDFQTGLHRAGDAGADRIKRTLGNKGFFGTSVAGIRVLRIRASKPSLPPVSATFCLIFLLSVFPMNEITTLLFSYLVQKKNIGEGLQMAAVR